MEEQENSEKLIGKLIKQRKEENEAFIRLLSSIEGKSKVKTVPNKSKTKK